MAMFVVVIVLVCYFFIPRKPTLCVTVGYPNDFSASGSGVNVSIPVNVSVANPNYYGFSLDQVTVNLVYKVDTVLTTTDATLSTVTAPDIHIKARGNSTNDFTVTMESNIENSAAYGQILQDCTPSGNTTVYINAAVTLLKRIHITVPNQKIDIQCSTVSAVGAATLLPGAAGLVNSTTTQNQTYCKKASW